MFTESRSDAVAEAPLADTAAALAARELRRCCACGQRLALTEFSFKNKARGTRQAKCKVCTRAYSKEHYSDNVEAYVAKAKVHNVEYAERNRTRVAEVFAHRQCKRCGSRSDLVCYDRDGYKRADQALHMAVHSGLCDTALDEALGRGEILCRACLGKRFAAGMAFGANAKSDERKRIQAEREKTGYVKTPRSAYKAYRRRASAGQPGAGGAAVAPKTGKTTAPSNG